MIDMTTDHPPAGHGRAKARNERQRLADKAHHEERIAWLSAPSPRYACGGPVPPSFAATLLRQSHEALRMINEHGVSMNSAPPVD